jgi:hypothetical protein
VQTLLSVDLVIRLERNVEIRIDHIRDPREGPSQDEIRSAAIDRVEKTDSDEGATG